MEAPRLVWTSICRPRLNPSHGYARLGSETPEECVYHAPFLFHLFIRKEGYKPR